MNKLRRNSGRDLFHRWEGNPILELEDMPFRCNAVFNCTPLKMAGQYLLLLRVEGQQGHSFFALAVGADPYHFQVEEQPVMLRAREEPFKTYESSGIEDPRLTTVDGVHYVMYTACGGYGHVIALAKTEDLRSFERVALVSEPGNKDGVLFPAQIDGQYVRLDRPIARDVGSIWISYSNDLIHWGNSKLLIAPRGGYWDSYRIGASAPPIQTPEGWLEIYHGVKMTSAGPVYRTGVVLLDLDDPSRVVGRCKEPVLSPREDYERIGDVGNVVFASGALVEDDGEVIMYYGAADTSICVATAGLDDLVRACRNGE